MATAKNTAGTETGINIDGRIGISSKFALINRLITRDLNGQVRSPSFYLYTKDNINEYLSNPYRYEKELRDAITYIYGASSHFRRLIQYFVSLSDLAYVVSPYRIDPKKPNARMIGNNYRKVLSALSSMSIRTQFPKILAVCLREDTFYGTMHVGQDSTIIQQLPSQYCRISSIENNVLNVTFDFSYFDSRKDLLEYYPEEFKRKYNLYLNNRIKSRWVELDAPTSFAVKCSNDILDYSLPPFAGILRDIYNIEDYSQLKMAKTALENYAMVVMNLPMDDDGNWLLDFNKAEEFWRNLDDVLPDEIGSVLTPMETEKISFERSHSDDTDTVTEAEENLYTAAGVSSLLFNNPKASANALLLSIKADQALTYGIVKSIEDVVNRYIQYQSYGKNFKVTFLDVSPFNRKEVGDAYLKASTYGLPFISMYAASQGMNQAELDTMSFLEGDVLGLVNMFKPIRNSAQMSSNETSEPSDPDQNPEGGRPVLEDVELTDSGEQSREDGDDWG